MSENIKPVRRIVVVDENDKSKALCDGPSPDVRTDPARPGFSSTRIWVTDRTPARIKGVSETLHMPHTIEPPPGGSVCRVMTFPPDDVYKGKVGAKEVAAYFAAMGSPAASAWSAAAKHPYLQHTATFDYCVVLEGELVLVLDDKEVVFKQGEVALLKGVRHAWSNRTASRALLAVSTHEGKR